MSELKTLSDLLHGNPTMDGDFIGAADGIELRNEAIAWIKKLDSNIYLFPSLHDQERYAPGLNNANREIIGWIQNFFNITEDELK